MEILNFLLEYWDSILVVLIGLAVIIALIAKKQYAILDQIILTLVVEAEKKYGDGTGAVKLASVIDWVYPKIPAVIRFFISEKHLEKMIENVLLEAKEKWKSNPKLSDYIKS